MKHDNHCNEDEQLSEMRQMYPQKANNSTLLIECRHAVSMLRFTKVVLALRHDRHGFRFMPNAEMSDTCLVPPSQPLTIKVASFMKKTQ